MKRTAYILSAITIIGGAVWAQDPQPGGPPPGGQPPLASGPPHGQTRPPMDPMAQHLFPPDLVMHNAQEIGLSEDQRHAIEGEMQKIQTQFVDLNKKLQGEMDSLGGLVKSEKVDEDKVRSQLDKVLSAENEIKKTQLGLMVRIKNQLTGQQQGQLREMRRQMMMNPHSQGLGGPGGGLRPSGPEGRPPRPPGDGHGDSGPRPNPPTPGGEPPRPPFGE